MTAAADTKLPFKLELPKAEPGSWEAADTTGARDETRRKARGKARQGGKEARRQGEVRLGLEETRLDTESRPD
jgi:hypothetical protein